MFKNFLNFLQLIGEVFQFTSRFFKEVWKPPFEMKEVFKQAYQIGYLSLPLVSTTAFILGLVFTIQTRPTLVEFGAESWLPSMVAIAIVREIGPVITAVICAGKVGSGIGAELASMRVTEQIDAMEVFGINPFKYLVVTRVIACTFMLPLLVIISDSIALYGSYLGTNIKGHISMTLFFSEVLEELTYYDLIPSIVKSYFFGFAIGMISCVFGYTSNQGTEGVGKAANSAVVISSLAVFFVDLIAAQLIDLLNK
jgi:phospholipid/cholesterol/gamma-HCH transport system permease protein